MAGRSRKNPVFTNPFYVGLLAVSTLFVVTALAYLAAPGVLEQGPAPQGPRSWALAEWLDRRAPLLLGVEFVVMLVAGVLAMLTDDWFAGRSEPRSSGGERTVGPSGSK
jgi:hypothetical protein